jgi:hypothetical protein
MSTDFDPLKAQREMLQRSQIAHKRFYTHARDTERRIAELEAQHSSALLMERLCEEIVMQERRKLRELEERSEAAMRGGAT